MSDISNAKITILLNPPKGLKEGSVMIGLGDDKIGEGAINQIITVDVPYGPQEILILVRNSGIDSWSSTTTIDVQGDMSLKIKYSLFSRSAKLVLDN